MGCLGRPGGGRSLLGCTLGIWDDFLAWFFWGLVTLRLRRKAHLGPLAPLLLSRGREGEGEGRERERTKERERTGERKRKREGEGGKRKRKRKGEHEGGERDRKGEGADRAAGLGPLGLAFSQLGPCLFLEICTFAF